MNHQALHWNVHCVANVGLKWLNLYKRGFKIYDLLVVCEIYFRSFRFEGNNKYAGKVLRQPIGLRRNVHCVANVGLRIWLNLYKPSFKIYDLLVTIIYR